LWWMNIDTIDHLTGCLPTSRCWRISSGFWTHVAKGMNLSTCCTITLSHSWYQGTVEFSQSYITGRLSFLKYNVTIVSRISLISSDHPRLSLGAWSNRVRLIDQSAIIWRPSWVSSTYPERISRWMKWCQPEDDSINLPSCNVHVESIASSVKG